MYFSLLFSTWFVVSAASRAAPIRSRSALVWTSGVSGTTKHKAQRKRPIQVIALDATNGLFSAIKIVHYICLVIQVVTCHKLCTSEEHGQKKSVVVRGVREDNKGTTKYVNQPNRRPMVCPDQFTSLCIPKLCIRSMWRLRLLQHMCATYFEAVEI